MDVAPQTRCAVRGLDDPMAGTAFPAARVLVVEQPGGWGAAGLTSSRLDPAVSRELVDRFGRLGVRVLAIRRPGRALPEAGAGRRWGFADTRPGRRSMVWGRFGADEDLLDLRLDHVRPAAAGPAYFVCAHGTRDVCCAVEGRPAAAALQGAAPEAVWECSHLGGDRFAANVLVLPDGVVYGRIRPAQAADLVSVSERGDVLISNLRGQVGMTAPAQAAMIFARRSLGLAGLDDLQVLAVARPTTPQAAQLWQVELSTAVQLVTVVVESIRHAPKLQTCRAARPEISVSYLQRSLSARPLR